MKNKEYDFRVENHELLRIQNHNLSFENWHPLYKAVNVDETYDNLCDALVKYNSISCPMVKVVHGNK